LDWGQYLSGNNPYDEFRGRPIMPDSVFEAKDSRGLEVMLKHTANNLGAGLIVRFESDNLYNPDPGKLQSFLKLPIISNSVGRFIKVSNRGVMQENERLVSEPIRTQRARTRVNVQEDVM